MDVVIGVYNGYHSVKTEKGGLYYFLKSLRKYNKECMAIVVVENRCLFPELVELCNKYNAKLYSDFNATNKVIMYYRFELYHDIFKKIDGTIRKVLMSDMNDVIFQSDPFSIEFDSGLYCAAEQNNYSEPNNSSSMLNMEWIKQCWFLPEANERNFDNKYVVCAGTILGWYKYILEYLEYYISIQRRALVNDQGLYNIYAHTVTSHAYIPHYTLSRILTLDKIRFENLQTCADGKVVNANGEVYAIIHQIDRCGNLEYLLNIADRD